MPIPLIVDNFERDRVARELRRFHTAQNRNITNAVEVFPDGAVNVPVVAELVIEVIDLLELLSDHLNEGFDICIASNLSDKVFFRSAT